MYTDGKDDYLDEDPVIPSQRWALVSILCPKTVKGAEHIDLTIPAFKIRGVFETEEAAEKRIEYLNKIDTYHHIFTMPVGRWCMMSEDAEDEKYANEKLNELMKKHKEQTDKIDALDAERQVNARNNARAHKRMMERNRKKLEKKTGKTTEELLAEQIISNEINTANNMTEEQLKEGIKKIHENPSVDVNIASKQLLNKIEEFEEEEDLEKVKEAKERVEKNNEQIMIQETTVDKLEQEYQKAKEQLEKLKFKTK